LFSVEFFDNPLFDWLLYRRGLRLLLLFGFFSVEDFDGYLASGLFNVEFFDSLFNVNVGATVLSRPALFL
jgi:hypothetical protein